MKLFVYRKGNGYIREAAVATDMRRTITGWRAARFPNCVNVARRGCLESRIGGIVVLHNLISTRSHITVIQRASPAKRIQKVPDHRGRIF